MFKNHLKIAWRQLVRQRTYSAIKIGGFALSIAACLLIGLYILDELSYDRQNRQGAQVFRVVGEATTNGVKHSGISFPAPMATALVQDFPEIEKAGRIMPNALFGGAGSNQIRRADGKESFYESGFCFADPSVLDILDIRLLEGDRSQALKEPFSMLISKSMAAKYFPKGDALGGLLVFNDRPGKPVKVAGIMEDFPHNAHLQYKFFISLEGVSFWDGEQETWNASNYGIYVLLKKGVDVERFQKRMTATVLDKYVVPNMKAAGRTDIKDLLASSRLYLQPLKDIHLRSYAIEQDVVQHGDIRFVWLFGAVAVFILLIACINFVNLSTAKSANRAKEVGLRKVSGSPRGSLVRQFLTESLLFSVLSFVLALVLARVLLPYFNSLSAKDLAIPWSRWWLLPSLGGAAAIIGLLAGIYPSFYLSAFQPIQVLKGRISQGSRASLLRNGLVVFQFTASIILIIGTVVIHNQMQFILNKKLGYDKEQVLVINGADALGAGTGSFKNELSKLGGVNSVSVSDYLPVAGTKRNGNTFWKEGQTAAVAGASGQYWLVDHDYLPTLGMKLVKGRNFSPRLPSDSGAVIINQTLARRLNLAEPVGARITNGGAPVQVIGVVEDFHFESLKTNIEGLCLQLGHSPSMMAVKIQSGNVKGLVATIASLWKGFVPAQSLRYAFLDDSFAAMYADVQRTGRIFTGFALLAIVIACLGLFALAAFLSEQRSKEIGIRKVLGASVVQVTSLLSRDFVKLVLLAILIASPVAWWAMKLWLQDFVYRIDISLWMFALAGGLAVLIALLTVSTQAAKAAVANPVDSLRSE